MAGKGRKPHGFDYDLMVIGGGSGGVRAARIAAGYGARVALAEEYRVGGTCVIRGCVPKKLMVYASRFGEEFEDSVGFGWTPGKASFDFNELIRRKDKEIDRLNAAYARTLDNAGVTVIHSRAELEQAHRVRLPAENRTVTAQTILVATGSIPHLDAAMPGIEHVITSNEMFHLEKLPKRLVIYGAGFIAVEFAAIMHGFGSEVTLVYRGAQILRGFDVECAAFVHEYMEKRGIEIICADTIRAVEKSGRTLVARTAAGRALKADQVMFAIGRKPHTEGLGLESAGVKLDANGAVVVDRFSRSSCRNIYAVGDVTNRLNLTPAAIREGHAFADTVFGGRKVPIEHAYVPKAVFSQPELGTVGLSEEEAKHQYKALDIYRARFRPMRHTMTGRDAPMLMKLIVDANTDRVLGCHIVGVDAAEMAQLVAIAIRMKAKKADFDATMALHPTAAEELVTLRTPSEQYRAAKPKAGKARKAA
jgi:glutathione reductase (NADPH)